MRFFFTLVSVLILNICNNAIAQEPLKIDVVADSAVKNYPKVLALYREVVAQRGSVLASKGFFDIRLRQEVIDKSRGFYDGKQANTEIVKRNEFLGSEIYGGYRKSFGSFENHETGFQTSRDGEFRAGARFSLLRNSMFDESRLTLALARLDLKESRQAVRNIKNEIRRDAVKAYYDWLVLGKVYETYKDLYQLALNRNKKIAIRVKKGDLAKIILTENERNALSRKAVMIKSLQDFNNASLYLSLFYRDEKGTPIIPRIEQMPSVNIEGDLSQIDMQKFEQDIILAMQSRADVNIMKISRQKELSNLKQAKNLYKPKLDVDFAVSNDVSNENQFQGQSKNEVQLSFEIPLQQRKARGEVVKARAKIDKIRYEEKLLKESIDVTLNQIKNNINNISRIHESVTQEVKLSKKLEKAEIRRFLRGGGNFFMVNLREQATARAKIQNSLIYAQYHKAMADYKAEVFME